MDFTFSSQKTWPALALQTIVLVAVFVLYRLYLRTRLPSALQHIPGPESKSWLYGNEWDVYNGEAGARWNDWISHYGNIVKYKNAFLNGWTVLVADPAAIKALLVENPDGFAVHKPPYNRDTNERLLGRGVIWAEADDHRRQRRLLSPAFSSSSVNEVSDHFYHVAEDLKDAWRSLLAKNPSSEVQLNMTKFMSSAALDVIGLAGFDHSFNAVLSSAKEADAITGGLHEALGAQPTFRMFRDITLAKAYPWISKAPLKAIRAQRASKASIDSVATKILERAQHSPSDRTSILSILLRQTGEASKLSTREILDNFSTMITAGHETTGVTLSLCLYEFARDREYQELVRNEIGGRGDGRLTYKALQDGDAPHLDALIKEVLRSKLLFFISTSEVAGTLPYIGNTVYPANIRIIRRSEKDIAVPLSESAKSENKFIPDRVVIPANTDIIFPITAINRLRSAWGDDADLFRPQRWLRPEGFPEAKKTLPSGYDNIFTFITGPRACLGMRFALAEIRVILSELLLTFDFKTADATPLNIVSPAQIMIRAQDPKAGYSVPLRVSLLDSGSV